MGTKNLCRGCTASVITPGSFIDELIVNAEKRGVKLATDTVFKKRVDVCQQCPSLRYESTCMHNGSLILYKAKLAESQCPFPFGSKWDEG